MFENTTNPFEAKLILTSNKEPQRLLVDLSNPAEARITGAKKSYSSISDGELDFGKSTAASIVENYDKRYPYMIEKTPEIAGRTPELYDDHYKKLGEKDSLFHAGKGPELTADEKADLYSKRQFPNARDEKYKKLATKEILAAEGTSPKLTPEEYADLISKRQFRDEKDDKYKKLAEKEYLSRDGKSPALTAEESADLASKRQFRDPADEYYKTLA